MRDSLKYVILRDSVAIYSVGRTIVIHTSDDRYALAIEAIRSGKTELLIERLDKRLTQELDTLLRRQMSDAKPPTDTPDE